MPVDAYLSQPHYWNHLRPVWEALPSEERGTVWTSFADPAHVLGCYEAQRGVPRHDGPPIVTAGGADARQVAASRLHFHMQHGVGQTYYGDRSHPIDSHGYTGGRDLDRVDVFLCVNPDEAEVWQRAYPGVETVVVGSPFLDGRRKRLRSWRKPTVVVTFHWPNRMIAEAGTAWPDWRRTIEAYAANPDVHLVGHEHPRWQGEVLAWWRSLGVETVADPAIALLFADALIADNTSLMYEAAALDLPVGCLNANGWRKDIHHGLRFWDAMPGLDYDPGFSFAEVISATLADGVASRERRRWALNRVWPDGLLDGRAAERAVHALLPRTTPRA